MRECLIVRKGTSVDSDMIFMKSYQNLYIHLNGGSVLTENEYNISKANCYNLINTLFGGTI